MKFNNKKGKRSVKETTNDLDVKIYNHRNSGILLLMHKINQNKATLEKGALDSNHLEIMIITLLDNTYPAGKRACIAIHRFKFLQCQGLIHGKTIFSFRFL